MSKSRLALLIHGPFADNCYVQIFKRLQQLPQNVLDKIQIIIVGYVSDKPKVEKVFSTIQIDRNKIKFVFVRDLFNPGYFNINRQVMCVTEGLKSVSGNPVVIKLRNDQSINFFKLFTLLKKLNYLPEEYPRIITTNCYTRPDRKYHPSDMFLCARKRELKQYYDLPISNETHMDVSLKLIKHYQDTGKEMFYFFECPENMLFQNYLKHKNWLFKNTKTDSYNAIKKYCYIANTWDIGLCWNKKRTPLLKKGSIILPYSVAELSPFPGLPPEKVQCYSRSDFEGSKTIKDKYYLWLSRLCFTYEYGNRIWSKPEFLKNIYYWGYKLPPNIIRLLKFSPLYKIYKWLSKPL
jgi:hypothetical protein